MTYALESIQDLIAKEAPLEMVLRLLCLASQTVHFKPKQIETLKREIVQVSHIMECVSHS